MRPTPNPIKKGELRSVQWHKIRIGFENVRTVLDSAKDSFHWRPYVRTRPSSLCCSGKGELLDCMEVLSKPTTNANLYISFVSLTLMLLPDTWSGGSKRYHLWKVQVMVLCHRKEFSLVLR